MSIQTLLGIQGIKTLFTKTLESKQRKLYTILTNKPLVYLAGQEFAEHYMQQRIEKEIFLQSLRLTDKEIDLQHHKDYVKLFKEIKTSKKRIFEHSLVIWDEFVAIVDVEKISCVLIENKENATLMKELFENLWHEAN